MSFSSWLKKAYQEEWPTMGNHLVASGASIGAATGFSYVSKQFLESDAAISGIATALDMGGYWGAFLPQLLYRDRKKLRDEKGYYNYNKITKKAGEYLSYFTFLEGVYGLTRFFGQYYMQRNGWDPAIASATIQLTATVFFTFTLPPIRYATRQWSES